MKASELRQCFTTYFEKHDHLALPSSSLIPDKDPTLLFTNAGMNQFKNVFLGTEKPSHPRAVTVQKCVRAGGKHNDLENVGHTARHHTFFEMLGNFSFGDYFKKEAIHFAWEFLTKELGLPRDKLYVTVFKDDDEAAEIWRRQEGVPTDRIYRFGEKDNFWRMGDTGPCGPSSEIFYDHGEKFGPNEKMGDDGDRFIEIWNLVFMQYFEQTPGKMNPLPHPSIDTGAGLERLAAVLQGVWSNYDTDSFQVLIQNLVQVTGQEYVPDHESQNPQQKKLSDAMKVLADHSRSIAFLLADGVLPSNEGRGYVLRRILRRAVRYGRTLSEESLLPLTVEKVIQEFGNHYGELQQRQEHILKVTKDEENRFLKTLDQGTEILNSSLTELRQKGGRVLSGEAAFRLYDTFGFPVDLTRLMAKEEGFEVDEASFEAEMEKARAVARKSWKGNQSSGDETHLLELTQKVVSANGETEFVGYQTLQCQSQILALSDGEKSVETLHEGDRGWLISQDTPFYAEGGGQIGDRGQLTSDKALVQVLDCKKLHNIYLHQIQVRQGILSAKNSVRLTVEDSQRRQIMANHSATHLLHAALRKTLGEHITQAGSLVEAERLRFDFTHTEALTRSQIEEIETLVNQEIAHGVDVGVEIMNPEEAQNKGALALFGEKYGERVRVIQMGGFSMELCGGTHVANTSLIRAFKIVSEAGVSAGVRRIEALTGDHALLYFVKNTEENLRSREKLGLSNAWAAYLKETAARVPQEIESLQSEIKKLQKEIKNLKGQQISADQLLRDAATFDWQGEKAQLIVKQVPIDDREVLSQLCDKLRDKMPLGVALIVGEQPPKNPLYLSLSKEISKLWPSKKILQELGGILKAKGGGRPDFGQGACEAPENLDQAKEKLQQLLGQ